LRTEEVRNVNFGLYILGAFFCRQTYSHGVCVFVPKNIQFYTINLDQYNKEKDLEICASILCDDLNINYLNDSSRKDLLDSLLASFNLFSTVKFPTRISNNSCSLIDNTYINTYRHEFSVHPLINGLSDHDAQIITLPNISISVPRHVFPFTRKIKNYLINKFTYLLSNENWEDVFLESKVNIIFNNFLNTFLRIFYSSFPVNKSHYSYKRKPWLTTGIRISCANKRKLYLTYRNSNDPSFKEYYKKYCRTLTKVILSAKKKLL
jgi:hypothetical protein